MTTPTLLAGAVSKALEPTKGAGTTLYIFNGEGDPVESIRDDESWERLAKIKELTPGELSAQSEDDSYLDDENADWAQTIQGEKSAGEANLTLAWKPGEQGQRQLLEWFDDGTLIFYKIVYPNGAIDLFRGWISGLGKTVAAKDIMTRTVKITNSGRPPALAEELADPEPAPEVEKLRASVKSTSTKSE